MEIDITSQTASSQNETGNPLEPTYTQPPLFEDPPHQGEMKRKIAETEESGDVTIDDEGREPSEKRPKIITEAMIYKLVESLDEEKRLNADLCKKLDDQTNRADRWERTTNKMLEEVDTTFNVGLLGEEVSRNGKLLLKTFEETNLTLINNNSKCTGKITRKNTKKDTEYSAIDFVVTNETVEKWVKRMIIDEDGIMKVKGKNDNETDHNTIHIKLNISNIDKTKVVKRTGWNLRASSTKWTAFKEELEKRKIKATGIITDPEKPIDARYKKWYDELETAARITIGKTTFKIGGKEKFSKEVNRLREEKKSIKKNIQPK